MCIKYEQYVEIAYLHTYWRGIQVVFILFSTNFYNFPFCLFIIWTFALTVVFPFSDQIINAKEKEEKNKRIRLSARNSETKCELAKPF